MIIKSKQFGDHTTIENSMIKDKNLSLKAKGLFCILASLPPDWVIYKTQLQEYSIDGRDSTISAFDELVDNGYIHAIQKINNNGQFDGFEYIVYPNNSISKAAEKPFTEIPKTEKAELQSKDIQRKDYIIPRTEKPKIAINDIKAYFIQNGYSETAAVKFFNFYDVAGWVDSNGKKVRSWKQKAQSVWFKEENKIKEEKPVTKTITPDEYFKFSAE